MKKITSPNAFKTSYIASVKEILNLPVRKAHNRNGNKRKFKAPEFHARFIIKAIRELEKEGKSLTYKNIQIKAFQIYQQEEENKIEKYMNIIKPSPDLKDKDIKNIIDSEVFEFES